MLTARKTETPQLAPLSEGVRYLKIKVKHLAAEARIIRFEERKVAGMDRWKLQHHRKTVVRGAARQAQVAYAYLRGKPCPCISGGSDLDEIQRMVTKYGPARNTVNLKDWLA